LREAHEKAFPASPAKAEGAGDDITKRLITGGANITVDKLASGGYLIDAPAQTSGDSAPIGTANYQVQSWVHTSGHADYVAETGVWVAAWARSHG